ncbi:MAG: glucosyltransferase [Piccolia ochrophora]|nr:MAG: glucosyltransferase [Piccolia ochrophora]
MLLEWSLPVALYFLTSFWRSWVNSVVPEPYLDEVFHVRQAQAYCNGQWNVWDPKITTPPGLYAFSRLLAYFHAHCDVASLRRVNSLVHATATFLLVKKLYKLIQSPFEESGRSPKRPNQKLKPPSLLWGGSGLASHVSLNIFMFPVLFFFTALYYTDVLSTSSVLAAYAAFHAPSESSTKKPLMIVIFGAIALSFRQTNIFWVGVFLSGLEVVRTLKNLQTKDYSWKASNDISEVVRRGWTSSEIYDVTIVEAEIEGERRAVDLIEGDKSNHIATIHVAQMLYIWPYFVFFSIPLVYPYIIAALVPDKILRAIPLQVPPRLRGLLVLRLYVVASFLFIILGIIHFNTIIHPFTLADNRHFVFYIFRWIVLRWPLRYLAAPVYLICGWASILALGKPINASENPSKPSTNPVKGDQRPSTQSPDGNKVSFVIIWLVSTSLSLATAPLVEPRYFIIPWVIWRLHVPPPSPRDSTLRPSAGVALRWYQRLLSTGRHQLWLESAWFLLVNVVVGYVFLFRGFTWPQEPGHTQRFLW